MEENDLKTRGPIVKEEPVGKRAWCSCSLSKKQPYCDGSHKGTAHRPVFVQFTEPTRVVWCGCKQTKTPPYCDGSHERL